MIQLNDVFLFVVAALSEQFMSCLDFSSCLKKKKIANHKNNFNGNHTLKKYVLTKVIIRFKYKLYIIIYIVYKHFHVLSMSERAHFFLHML